MPAFGRNDAVSPYHQVMQFKPGRLHIVQEPEDFARIDAG
jgi:hypothetical protein